MNKHLSPKQWFVGRPPTKSVLGTGLATVNKALSVKS